VFGLWDAECAELRAVFGRSAVDAQGGLRLRLRTGELQHGYVTERNLRRGGHGVLVHEQQPV
jgi:hypothetical protein